MPQSVTYAELEAKLVRWVLTQPAIRGVVVVGSRARVSPPPDDWSDLDLVVFTLDPAAYTTDARWIRDLGEAWLTVLDQTGAGDPEWYALFPGGLKADFVLSRADPAAAGLDELIRASPYRSVFHRGVRALYDAARPSQPPARLDLPAPRPILPPTPGEFESQAQRTLLLANRTARFYRRGDIWRAREHLECRLRRQLLVMLEWHAWAQAGGAPPDTWHDGRFLERWADPRALAALPTTWPAEAHASVWRALVGSLDLYAWLAREAAEHWGYVYPDAAEAHLRRWLAEIEPPAG